MPELCVNGVLFSLAFCLFLYLLVCICVLVYPIIILYAYKTEATGGLNKLSWFGCILEDRL